MVQLTKRTRIALTLLLALMGHSRPHTAAANILGERPDRSVQSLRFDPGVQQLSDHSCGASAVSNLLTVFFDMPVTEESVLRCAVGGRDRQITSGLSVAEIRRSLESLGLESRAYRADLETLVRILEAIKAPVIAQLATPAPHYVIVIAPIGSRLLVFDPDLGLRTITTAEMGERWGGVLIVVDPGESALESARAAIQTLASHQRLRMIRLTNLF